METLANFLNLCQVRTGYYNLVSLNGGKYNILPSERAQFFSLYKSAAEKFTQNNHCAFVYRPPKRERQPLYIDVDIKTKAEIGVHTDLHHRLAVQIAKLIDTEGSVDYMLVQKPTGYWKTLKNKDTNEHVYCTGSHILFPRSDITLDRAETIRNSARSYISEIFRDIDLANGEEDVLDKRVTSRANGLMFLYDYKRKGCGGQYQVKLVGSIEGENHSFCEYKGDEYLEHLDMEMIYGFAFQAEQLAEIPSQTKQKTISGEKLNFNLDLYMAALGHWIPPQELYVKLVMFFANTNISPEYTAELCNQHWAPPGHQRNETLNMLYKYKGNSTVTRGTAQWILQQHATNPYNLKAIFPEKVFLHYNDYTSFVGKLNRRRDINDFLRQTVGYIFKGKKFVWKTYTVVRDKHGQVIKNEVTNMSKNPPFIKSDDLRVQVFPLRSDLIDALECKVSVRTKDKNEIKLYTEIHEVLNTAAVCPIEELYEKTTKLLEHKCPKPEYKLMSKFVTDLHLSHEIIRYSDVVFKPFPGKNAYTDKTVLNTFSGFPFEWYTPTKQIDVKQTHIWKFLVDVYGSGHAGPLLDHVLNIFAHLVQKPHIRSERITAILSIGEGTGKSTVFHILKMLLSAQYCKFHASLTPYLDRFNITNLGKLIHWCDDISASNQKETRLLFSRATSHTQKYEQKGETSIEMAEYSNLFITANEECPLHTHPGDRRQQIFIAADTHIQDRPFFAKVYEEVERLDVGYAFYQYFKNRDLGEWDPSFDPPTNAKGMTIAACIKKSHTFLNEFFVEMDWLTNYIPTGKPWSTFLSKIEAKVVQRGERKGELRIRIEYQTFYCFYRAFMKGNYPSSRARNIDTFLKETAILGVCKSTKRQQVNKNNYIVVDIYYALFSKLWVKEYPDIPLLAWDSEIKRDRFLNKLLKCQVMPRFSEN